MSLSARRLGIAVLVIFAGVVTAAPAARADAAGPTDYLTKIVSVEPATDSIALEMIGGDSFMSLELIAPVEVIVTGYRGEPYLRFAPDGQVFENRRSPSAWLNQDRYGTGDPPDYTDPTATPEWLPVADSGRFAWHDHRSHWMLDIRPLGRSPGDVVLEATVPIIVDGVPVTVGIESTWLEAPPLWPAIAGGGIGLLALAAAVPARRFGSSILTAAVGGIALILGVTAYQSVPPETEPSALLWLLPAVSVAAGLAALMLRKRLVTTVYLDGLIVASGALLGYWGLTRSDGLRRALIPSNAPASLDRIVITAALVVGAATVLIGLGGLVRPQILRVP